MNISVVIPTYKRPGLAENLKQQILLYFPNCEVLIIDQSDSSEPNTSRAKNEGMKKSTGEIVIFFDDDVEITKETISAHVREYENPNVVGVSGRVINDGESVPSSSDVVTGETNNYLTKFNKSFWSTRKQTVEFVYGCNMSFRRKVLLAVSGFDEKWPTPLSAFEEIDLSFRVGKLGLISFSPSALVYHHRAVSGGTRLDQKSRNDQYYLSYGRLVSKHVTFPFSLVSFAVIVVRIMKESPSSISHFLTGLMML